MVTVRNTRQDVIEAAGRLFAEQGLSRDLDAGSRQGARPSRILALRPRRVQAGPPGGSRRGGRRVCSKPRLLRHWPPVAQPTDQLRRLIAGHVGVVLDNPDVVRTYLNEARMLDAEHRNRVIAARDAYEQSFPAGDRSRYLRRVLPIRRGPEAVARSSSSRSSTPSSGGTGPRARANRDQLVDELSDFCLGALRR